MNLVKKGIKVDQDIWDKLAEKANEIRHTRNNLINRLFEAVIKMDKDELIRLIYSTGSPS